MTELAQERGLSLARVSCNPTSTKACLGTVAGSRALLCGAEWWKKRLSLAPEERDAHSGEAGRIRAETSSSFKARLGNQQLSLPERVKYRLLDSEGKIEEGSQ